jgi:hypothetical protein
MLSPPALQTSWKTEVPVTVENKKRNKINHPREIKIRPLNVSRIISK